MKAPCWWCRCALPWPPGADAPYGLLAARRTQSPVPGCGAAARPDRSRRFCGLASNPQVGRANKDGRTALMWACKNGEVQVVTALLHLYAADVSARMKDDSTAFDWAVLGGHVPTMELLAAHPDVDIRALNKFGCAAVQWAAASGNVNTCRWLYSKGIDFSHINHAGHGAVVKAAWKGHDDALRWLLIDPDGPTLTAQLHTSDLDFLSAAQLARNNGNESTADWLEVLMTYPI